MPIIMGFLGLSVVELGRGTRQTDEQTDNAHHFIMRPPYGGRGHNKQVWSPTVASITILKHGRLQLTLTAKS